LTCGYFARPFVVHGGYELLWPSQAAPCSCATLIDSSNLEHPPVTMLMLDPGADQALHLKIQLKVLRLLQDKPDMRQRQMNKPLRLK